MGSRRDPEPGSDLTRAHALVRGRIENVDAQVGILILGEAADQSGRLTRSHWARENGQSPGAQLDSAPQGGATVSPPFRSQGPANGWDAGLEFHESLLVLRAVSASIRNRAAGA